MGASRRGSRRPCNARLAALAAAAVLAPAGGARASEWIGHSAFGNNWTDVANWFLINPPGPDETANFTGLGGARPRPFLNADWTVRRLAFSDGVAYDLQGNSRLTLGASRFAPLTNGISTDSSVEQNVRFPIRLGNDAVFRTDPGSGQLYLRGPTDTNGHDLLLRAQGGTITLIGGIGGTGNVLMDGGRTAVYNASNTYTGYTHVLDGTLVLGNGGRIADASTLRLAPSTVFRMTGQTDAVAGLDGEGTVRVDDGSRLVLGNYSSLNSTSPGAGTFGGTIAGNGGVSKRGTGTQYLDGTLDFTGDLIVEEGRLNVAGETRAAPDVVLAPAGSLNFVGRADVGTLNGAGGTLNVNAALSVTGGGNFGGLVTGSGQLSKRGTGTLTLGGAYRATGGVSVGEGTLHVRGGVPTAPRLDVAGAARLELDGGVTEAGTLSGTGEVRLLNGATLVVGRAAVDPFQFYAGRITGDGSLAKVGPHALWLLAESTHTGATTVSGGTLAFAASQRVSGLHIGAGADAVIPQGIATTLVMGSLDIAGEAGAWTGTFDVGLGAAAVDYDGASASPLSQIADQVRSAYRGGDWDGEGITSFRANDDSIAVGYAESAAAVGPDGGTFAGEAVDGTAVLLRATRYGDADLDGTVTFDDLLTLRRNHGATGDRATWQTGDFDYDGRVDARDLFLLRSNYGTSLALPAPAAADGFTAVPEPAATAVLLPAVTLLLRRQHRQRRRGVSVD